MKRTILLLVQLISLMAMAGGPGSGRHKEKFDSSGGDQGGLVLIIAISVVAVVFFLVAAIVGTIQAKKAKKKFMADIDLLLKNQELNHDEWLRFKSVLGTQGHHHANAALRVFLEERRKQQEVGQFIADVDVMVNNGEITQGDWTDIKRQLTHELLPQARSLIKSLADQKTRQDFMIKKYGIDKGMKLFNQEYFIGMTKEELIDSAGQPTKIENEVLKTKTKETWIYGNKSSGDVFVFENEILARFKDR